MSCTKLYELKKLMNDIEKQRIEGLRRGSIEDFNLLYSIYADSLYSFSLKLLKSRSEAQDIVQDTFLKIWIKRAELSTEFSFKAYLYTIAKNKILTSFRQRVNEITIEEFREYAGENAISDIDVEQHVINKDIKYNLYSSIAKLPPLQAKIFIMKSEEDLSTQEIATLLGIPHQTIKNNLSKAMKSMRDELKKISVWFMLIHI